MDYLQPGSVTVCPGGWHLALASFGPPPLLPGPKLGSASAAGASAPSTPNVANRIATRFLMVYLHHWISDPSRDAPLTLSGSAYTWGDLFIRGASSSEWWRVSDLPPPSSARA